MVRKGAGAALFIALAATMAPVSAPAASRGVRPDAWGGRIAFGYEDRKDAAFDPGDPSLGTGTPRFWFAEPDDAIGNLRLWASWKYRPFGQRTKIEFAFERWQWAQGEILNRNTYELEVKQDLSTASRMELDVEYSPRVYKQHRRDKDAAPGEPMFRPEAYEELELELGYERAFGPHSGMVFGSYTLRDETEWFDERDRWRRGAGINLDLQLSPRARVEPEYEYRVTTSRNEPDLGDDYSYREHLVQLRARTTADVLWGPWDLEARTRWKFRGYTTDNPDDQSRFERNDQIYLHEIKIRHPVGRTTPFIRAEFSGRWVDAPADEDIADDYDQTDRTFLQLGIEWELEL